MNGAVFDAAAPRYDAEFSERRLGRWLRERVHRGLEEAFAPGDHVIDLGCGSGEDAVWLARRGLRVTALDASAAMLSVARAKAARENAAERIEYRQIDLSGGRLDDGGSRYDGAYSNFGALNCVADRRALAAELGRLVRPGGRLVLVVMGPFCAWETIGNLCRGRAGVAVRRFRRRPLARVGGGESFPVRYPSARRLRREFEPWFRPVDCFGLGVVLPPTEFRDLVDRWPRLFSALAALDRRVGAAFGATWVSDHHVTHFERR